MAPLSSIQDGVRAMTAGVERAQQEAAGADHAAQQIAQRAAASGFLGIAQSMARVRTAIGELRGGVSTVGEAVREAGALVAATPTRPTAQETIAACAPLGEKMDSIRTAVGGCVERVDQAKKLTAAVLHGGEPGPMLGRLDGVRQVLVALAHRVTEAKQHVETALAEAKATGRAGN